MRRKLKMKCRLMRYDKGDCNHVIAVLYFSTHRIVIAVTALQGVEQHRPTKRAWLAADCISPLKMIYFKVKYDFGEEILFVILAICFVAGLLFIYRLRFYSVAESEKHLSFNEWYKNRKQLVGTEPGFHTFKVESPFFQIDLKKNVANSPAGPGRSSGSYSQPSALPPSYRVRR